MLLKKILYFLGRFYGTILWAVGCNFFMAVRNDGPPTALLRISIVIKRSASRNKRIITNKSSCGFSFPPVFAG